MLLSRSFLVYCCLSSIASRSVVHGFHLREKTRRRPTALPFGSVHARWGSRVGALLGEAVDGGELENVGEPLDPKLVAAASEKLAWELTEDRRQKPILNLSSRDASPEETQGKEDECENISEWDRGQRWKISLGYLSDLGVDVDATRAAHNGHEEILGAAMLENCPQLVRLKPEAIRDTAEWIATEFGLGYLKDSVLPQHSVLLSFRSSDASYGLEFMGLMMMGDARPACSASPAFLVTAIEGGLQERTVGKALGAAGEATSKASRSIASDTMESFRQLRGATRHKK
ncbi:unnamed protein product [Pseudo-nitzschia multistriata]|uniref:Uncharacterized protein n=1 Tax=Pseudo-nitzschia multistriata TaxID=183589 RepID=A0A448ZBJ6_9STRA|nr:unnamed protein product [Pseudo-nitzschia multistriata]